jgi:hypothetical protein
MKAATLFRSTRGDAPGIGGPAVPLQAFRDERAVVVLHQFEPLILIADDFQKEHPAQL